MKLTDLKSALIEQFFKSHNGIKIDELPSVVNSLGLILKEDISSLAIVERTQSQEPSKAFGKFASGKRSLLLINETDIDGNQLSIIFAASRSGKKISYIDLTAEIKEEKVGTFAIVKQALQQAKNLDDDAYFYISTEGK